MLREPVATLRVRHLDPDWGLGNVRVKGGKTRDIPFPQGGSSSTTVEFYEGKALDSLSR